MMATDLSSLPVHLLQPAQSLLYLGVIFVPLEWVFAQRIYPAPRKQLGQDLIFFLVNSLLPPVLLAAALGGLVALIRPLYATGIFSWSNALPLPIRFILAVIIGDIGGYWGHRWSHEIPLLWRFHRIHHQAEALDWLVTNRAHPFDTVFLKFCGVAFIYLTGLASGSLGQGTALMSSYVVIGGIWAYFVHANIGWRFGRLEPWLASPAFHHWHHSNESKRSLDKNYAALFPFIDRLFGTLHLPRRRWPRTYGECLPSPAVSPPRQTAPSAD
jgi:sterol desaturase/sphingolipid hydroxylase (fatty acid hydroxylase superfamily)